MSKPRYILLAALAIPAVVIASTIIAGDGVDLPKPDFKDANPFKVIRVVDGDTIDLMIGGKKERCRLIGVDTPETVHPRSGSSSGSSSPVTASSTIMVGFIQAGCHSHSTDDTHS